MTRTKAFSVAARPFMPARPLQALLRSTVQIDTFRAVDRPIHKVCNLETGAQRKQEYLDQVRECPLVKSAPVWTPMAAWSEDRSLLMVPVGFAQPARAHSVQEWSNLSECHVRSKQKRVLSRVGSRMPTGEISGHRLCLRDGRGCRNSVAPRDPLREHVQQRLGVREIGGVETFGETVVDLRQQIVRLADPLLIGPELREIGRGTQPE
jgi:hypothetical protein